MCSTPFDWVATSKVRHLIHILSREFEDFLDKRYIVDHPDGQTRICAGHSLYGERFFHHFDPRKIDHRLYYERCISRFLNIKHLPQGHNILFVVQIMNDTIDEEQLLEIHRLLQEICERDDIYLCAIQYISHQTRRYWRVNHLNSRVCLVNAKIKSHSLGWKFEDEADGKRLYRMIDSLYDCDIQNIDLLGRVDDWERAHWN